MSDRDRGPCPLGVNGGEFPHWSVGTIAELAVKLGAEFVELPTSRIAADPDGVRAEVERRALGVHVSAMVSDLTGAFAAARAVGAPFVVAVDDAIERTDAGRRESLARFRELVLRLLTDGAAPGAVRLALENSVIRITRQPEDLLDVLAAVDHPRFGINFDADTFYNSGLEAFPYAYELLRAHVIHVHVKDSARYIPAVHGEGRRVLHRAGGNMVCVPVGTGAVNWIGLIGRLRVDGYRGPVSLEPHMLPHEMAPGMEADAEFLRHAGLVR